MTRKVILEDKDGEELVPYTELATNQQPGRVRPDGSSLVVDSNGVISVNGATGTEIGYLSGVTSGIQGQLDNTVHKTGNETIAGVKTFASGSSTSLITKSDKIDSDIKPSSTQFSNFIDGYDVNGKLISRIFTRKASNGSNGIAIQAWNGSTNYSLGVYSDGTSEAPTPPTGDNSKQIATTAYVTNKVSTKADKASFQVVSALPANPDANTFYFIPE